MASPSSNANNQIVLVSPRSHAGPSVGQGGAQPAAAPLAPAPVENNQLLLPEHDREYGCRFCTKKFSNKQALGGHQNAHKVERAMEKDNGLGYFGSHHGRLAAPFLASCNHRPHDFAHRTPYSWSFTSHHRGGGGARVIPYTSRPLPGPRFPGRAHYPLPGQNMNIRLANFGAGSANAALSGGRGGGGPSGPINLRNVPAAQQNGESNLDLSLKL